MIAGENDSEQRTQIQNQVPHAKLSISVTLWTSAGPSKESVLFSKSGF
jgi:hypothetical protein